MYVCVFAFFSFAGLARRSTWVATGGCRASRCGTSTQVIYVNIYIYIYIYNSMVYIKYKYYVYIPYVLYPYNIYIYIYIFIYLFMRPVAGPRRKLYQYGVV